MSPDDALFADVLEAWEASGLRRTLAEIEGEDFCSNDYLGLAHDPRLAEAIVQTVHEWGTGSRAARLLGGQLPLHRALETDAAAWLGVDASLLFPSGWQANTGLLSALPGARDVVLSDRSNHASLIDGMRLSPAAVRIFAHNDPASLESQLRDLHGYARRWIVVESVYSMDGSFAPLDSIAELAREYDAWLIVDEAHAVGLYGPNGQGRVTTMNDASRVVARVITGGKALGIAGALVGGSRSLIDLLIQRARPFVFTTSPMPALVGGLRAAIGAVAGAHGERAHVHRAAKRLRGALPASWLASGESPIVFVHIGDPAIAVSAAARLQDNGFYVRAVRPPTVRRGGSGLRVVCHADHDDATIDQLASALRQVLAGLDVVATDTTGVVPGKPDEPRTIVVVGTDTDVGKTVVSAAMMGALHDNNTSAMYWKAIQTGPTSDTEIVQALANLAEDRFAPPARHFPVPASMDQAARAEGAAVGVADLLDASRDVKARCDAETVLVIETSGGILVPLNDHEDQGQFVAELGAPVILVARSGLGTLNHTLLTAEALKRRGVVLAAIVLVGLHHEGNVRSLQPRLGHVPILSMPQYRSLDGTALRAWCRDTGFHAILMAAIRQREERM